MIKIQLPSAVKYIIDTIEQVGFEAYAVGGCVRDTILGRIPDDWDITTSAKPEDIKKIFRHTVDTGIKHGTVTVLVNKEGYEVTTYRIDGEYEDSRHPKEVRFTSLLSEDLKRRDFTINAMAYNESKGLVDLFGGREDLKNGVIRCVGNPRERFGEDALRIMRAVRFSAQLGYQIEEQTKTAILELAHTLSKISVERIQVELIKLLVSKNPQYVLHLYELGITKVVLPEFDMMMDTGQNNPHHIYSVGMHTIKVLEKAACHKIIRLTALFHDVAKSVTKTTDEDGIDHFYEHTTRGAEMSKEILKRLRFDNDTIDKVSLLVYYHDEGNSEEVTPAFARKLMSAVKLENFPLLLEVKYADVLAQSDLDREKKLEKIKVMWLAYEEVLQKGLCVQLKDMAITGNDLILAGMKPGKFLGDVLKQLLEVVIEKPEMNTKESLMYLLKEWCYI